MQLNCPNNSIFWFEMNTYSGVPIKRAGSIKQAGWNFHDFFPDRAGSNKSEQGGKLDIFFTEMVLSRVEFLEI